MSAKRKRHSLLVCVLKYFFQACRKRGLLLQSRQCSRFVSTLNFAVIIVDEGGQGGQALLHHFQAGRGVLVPAQVGDGPGHVAEESDRLAGVHQTQERLQDAVGDDEIAEVASVAGDVTQGPDRLFTHVLVTGRQEADEMGNGAGVDHDLAKMEKKIPRSIPRLDKKHVGESVEKRAGKL